MKVREFLKICPPNKAFYITDKTMRKFCYNTTDADFILYLDNEVLSFDLNNYGSDIIIYVEGDE